MPEEAEKKLDETVPGGKYEVNGKTVDANGDEIGKKKDNSEADDKKTK